MSKEKVVLAYSGGLDTSVILKWLIEQDYEVIAFIADVGQKENYDEAKEKALKIGASKVYIEDLKEEFVTDYIFPAMKANAVYENRYLQGTAIARPLIAKAQIEIAIKEGAQYVSHGATGKGNDQVRFELGYAALAPDIKVIAPWKIQSFLDHFKGRSDMLAYAEKHNIPVTATLKKPYSEDENLLHISHEAGILEDPSAVCAEDVYSWTTSPQQAPNEIETIDLTFAAGAPTALTYADGTTVTQPLALFNALNDLGAKHGIGRVDMVENRFVGIKSRGVYETPGGTILHHALRDLEGLTLDREVLKVRDMFSGKVAELIYYGFWFSPEMEVVSAAIDKATENLTGTVTLQLYKGTAYPVARSSAYSLYNEDLSSMDIEGGFDQKDSAGFININAVRLKTNTLLKNSTAKKDIKNAA